MNHKYRILTVALFGVFVGNIEAVMPNAGLSTLVKELHISVATGTWILTIYTLLFATFMPVFGKIGDMIGHQRLYIWSLFTFSIATLFCGLFHNPAALIIGRAIEGISIAPSLPAAMAMISRHFASEERGKAMGIFGVIVAASTAVGAPLGGVVTQFLGWPAMFYIIVPVALLGLVLSIMILPKEESKQGWVNFDWAGALFFSTSIVLGMLFVTQGFSKGGWASFSTWIALAGFILCFAIFFVLQKRISSPFIPLRLFSSSAFNAVSTIRALQMSILYGSQFLIPLYWVRMTHATTGAAGIGLLILPVAIMISAPIAGRLTDRRGSKGVVTVGMALTVAGSAGLLFFSGSVQSPVMWVTLFVLGFGFGFVQSSSMTAVTLSLRGDLFGVGLGVFNMLTFVGGTIGLSIFGTVVGSAGFQVDYLVMALLGIVGAVLAFSYIPKAMNKDIHEGNVHSV